MLIIALLLSLAGTWLLNQTGSLTADKKALAVGLVLNGIAVALFANLYGGARGTFIFLGIWALVGMIITFVLPYLAKQKT